jgi:hypothetical protein
VRRARRCRIVPAVAYGITQDRLAHVTCWRAEGPAVVDGDLDKPAWRDVPRSPPFVDMVSGEPALLETRVACQWDDTREVAASGSSTSTSPACGRQ